MESIKVSEYIIPIKDFENDKKLSEEFLSKMLKYLSIKPIKSNMVLYNSIYIEPILKQIKFPKSKKKRIRNKWKNNKDNWKYCEIVLKDKEQNIFYISTKFYNELKNKYGEKFESLFIDGNSYENKYFNKIPLMNLSDENRNIYSPKYKPFFYFNNEQNNIII